MSTLYTIHYTPYTIHNTKYTIHNTQYTIHGPLLVYTKDQRSRMETQFRSGKMILQNYAVSVR